MGFLDSNGLAHFWGKVKGYVDGYVSSEGGIPVGTIVIWSGTADNIPDGWALCDGQDGRPDLRDKDLCFIIKIAADKADVYSDEETVIGTWFGKPLYRKVFKFDGVSVSSTRYVYYWQTGLPPNVCIPVHMYGCVDSGDGFIYPIPYAIGNTSLTGLFQTYYYTKASYVYLATKDNNATTPITTGEIAIVMEYIKTTD